MSIPRPALANVNGTTRVRLAAVAAMTPQQARQLAMALLDDADLADHANGVSPKAAPFVPATPEALDENAGGWDEPLPGGAR